MPTGIYKRTKPSWNKGKKCPQISIALTGKKLSKEHIEKMRQAKLKNPIRYWLGKKRPSPTKTTRKKMSEAQTNAWIRNGDIRRKNCPSGKNSWNWKGGTTMIDKLIRGMKEYFQWRSDVFQRDNWTCKTCGRNGCYVTAHHIKGLNKIIRENDIKNIIDARKCSELWDINNGITLCEDCHSLTDNYRGRANHKKIIK